MPNVVEKASTPLQSEEGEERGQLSDRQFASRKGQSAINAAAIMGNNAHAAWICGHITGMVLKVIKVALPRLAKG